MSSKKEMKHSREKRTRYQIWNHTSLIDKVEEEKNSLLEVLQKYSDDIRDLHTNNISLQSLKSTVVRKDF